jgi:hypothetical protein
MSDESKYLLSELVEMVVDAKINKRNLENQSDRYLEMISELETEISKLKTDNDGLKKENERVEESNRRILFDNKILLESASKLKEGIFSADDEELPLVDEEILVLSFKYSKNWFLGFMDQFGNFTSYYHGYITFPRADIVAWYKLPKIKTEAAK